MKPVNDWRHIIMGHCPRCKKGPIFRGRVEVFPSCSICGLVFIREQGYFLGAMYLEYALSAFFLAVSSTTLGLGFHLTIFKAVGLSLLIFLPFIPSTIRLSRTLWLYWDNHVDPQTF